MTYSKKRAILGLAVSMLPAILASVLGGAVALGAGGADQPAVNQLSDAEKKAGWKLLFDGKTFGGWHNFKKEGVAPGWQIKDGAMTVVDPKKAGDIVTNEKFDWFELSLEYNIAEAGNSGIMIHVTDNGTRMWQTGPEIQIEDNQKATDQVRSGWLYQIYKPEIDPATKKPVDATKPVGEWNHIRVVIAAPPGKSEVDMNGVKYFDFVYGSDDFKARVAKSKFAKMPQFAKSDSGFLGLQGDHGSVAYRNLKIRPLGITAP